MNRQKIEELVLEEVNFLLRQNDNDVDQEVTLESSIRDMGLDSLDIVELLTTVEEEYQVAIPDDQIAECDTLSDVVDVIINLL